MELGDPRLTQGIRVLDVAVIGPVMVYGGAAGRELHPVARVALVAFGLTTVAYNAVRFDQERRRLAGKL